MKVISIEGIIGAGKSTLISLLQERLENEVTFLQEPIEEWQNVGGTNLLNEFYKDSSRYSYLFQCRVFLTRVKQLQNIFESPNCKDIVIIERSWFSDRMCFAQVLWEDGIITDMEWAVYKEMFDWIQNFCPNIDKYIYVRCDVFRAMLGISDRNRKEESNIPKEYLESLSAKHDNWLLQDRDDVLVIDSNKNFIINSEYLDEIVDSIRNFINT